MIKIYDTNKKFLKLIDKCKDMCTVASLDTGLQTLSFKLPLNDQNLAIVQEEGYVTTADYNYVIKEVNQNDHKFISVYCNPEIEELKYTLIPVYDVIGTNIQGAFEAAINTTTEWKLDYQSTYQNQVEYHMLHQTPYEVIKMLKEDWGVEVFFDTKEKKVRVYNHMGGNRGMYFSNELRLQLLKKQSQSYDFTTVLFPVGKDNLSIASVNNGSSIIENYQYCGKYLPKYYIQNDITEAQQLKMMAEAYLAYYSAPITGYALSLSGLPQDIQLGDDIILVDKIKRTKQKQRIKKIYRYPFEPEKDKVELSNAIVNFADTLTKFQTNTDRQIEYIKNNLATLE